MKKFFYLSIAMLTLVFSSVACSDDDDPKIENNKELKQVISKLETMKGVTDFTQVLKSTDGIDVGTGSITVFAVEDKTESTLSADGAITKDNIVRHIATGIHSLPKSDKDTVIIKAINKESIKLTMKDGKVLVNGISMESSEPVMAGNSQIYVITDVLPATPATISNFTVYEANEEWAEGADEKKPSNGAFIKFYEFSDDKYVLVDSAKTDTEGKVAFSHYYTEDLFYNVENGEKTFLRENYQVVGLFTTQAQIDEAPEYATGTDLDKIKLGALRIADINGDGVINEDDKIESGYQQLDFEAENTELFIVSDTYGVEEEPEV